MACPFCGEQCFCPALDAASEPMTVVAVAEPEYSDPDPLQLTEERFEASLTAPAAKATPVKAAKTSAKVPVAVEKRLVEPVVKTAAEPVVKTKVAPVMKSTGESVTKTNVEPVMKTTPAVPGAVSDAMLAIQPPVVQTSVVRRARLVDSPAMSEAMASEMLPEFSASNDGAPRMKRAFRNVSRSVMPVAAARVKDESINPRRITLQTEGALAHAMQPEVRNEEWRSELSDRVAEHKARRKKHLEVASMDLFAAPVEAATEPMPVAIAETVLGTSTEATVTEIIPYAEESTQPSAAEVSAAVMTPRVQTAVDTPEILDT